MIDKLSELMKQCTSLEASDIHLTVDAPPMLRRVGKLERFGDEKITARDTLQLARLFLNPQQFEELETRGEYDISVSSQLGCRFRVNIFRQKGSYAIAMRNVNPVIQSLEELNLPSVLTEFTKKNHGIVLITGPTGSGKSTTLATLIDMINTQRDGHIITLEDPIEFLHKHKRSIVNQREIGSDSMSFKNALRASLREDPDVILIGEMRDFESISIALTAAETGHLVFSTLHTVGAAKTIDRIIDVFPAAQQQQIRIQLSMTLQGVVSQQLIPKTDKSKRVVATEIMFANSAIRNLIRESKTPQINNAITTARAAGMLTMDDSLLNLYRSNTITYEDMLLYSVDPEYIKMNAAKR